mgnify:CR=1 FL=1|tara:strand:- start:537 stop:716 length:180 start_codon:yes stop_codon:yes gene_type:complete
MTLSGIKPSKVMDIDEAIKLIKGPKYKPVKLILEGTNEKGKNLKFAYLEILLKFRVMNL